MDVINKIKIAWVPLISTLYSIGCKAKIRYDKDKNFIIRVPLIYLFSQCTFEGEYCICNITKTSNVMLKNLIIK